MYLTILNLTIPFYWRTLPFVAELLTAEFLYLHLFRRRSRFAVRYFAAAALCALYRLVSTALPISNMLGPILGAGLASSLTNLFLYASVLLLSIFAMRCCFKGEFPMILAACTAGYATQHFAYKVYDIARTFLPLDEWIPGEILSWLLPEFLCHAAVYILFYFLFCRPARRYNYKVNGDPFLNLLSVAIIAIGMGINRLAIDSSTRTDIQVLTDSLYAMTCCLLALIIQFSLLERSLSHTELELNRALLKEQARQYEQWKSSLEAINIKYHDLRHTVNALKDTASSGDAPARIHILEQLLDKGFARIQTGSEMLDVLLASKKTLCDKKKITFTCMADSGALADMNSPELFALFCNALDNAIDAVMHVPEEKRIISLGIRHIGDYIEIHLENYFAGTLTLVDGLPSTNAEGHGYGMKSMRSTVEQFGGAMSISADNGVFHLQLLLPIRAAS